MVCFVYKQMQCPVCDNPMVKRTPWGNDICYECGAFYDTPEFVITNLNYGKTIQKRAYKRLDHFKEVLYQFQGKEGRQIPADVFDKVKASIGKDKEHITTLDIKQCLRRLKLGKYVENIFYIDHVLSGTPLPYIRREVEDKMVRLFKQVERIFGTVRSRVGFARTSFLNYYYVIYKLLESLQPELLPRVPLIKTSGRLKHHDAMWKELCEELGWGYVPTRPPKNTVRVL